MTKKRAYIDQFATDPYVRESITTDAHGVGRLLSGRTPAEVLEDPALKKRPIPPRPERRAHQTKLSFKLKMYRMTDFAPDAQRIIREVQLKHPAYTEPFSDLDIVEMEMAYEDITGSKLPDDFLLQKRASDKQDPEAVGYDEMGGMQAKRCGKCAYFMEPNACEVVNGSISSDGICDLFDPLTEDKTASFRDTVLASFLKHAAKKMAA